MNEWPLLLFTIVMQTAVGSTLLLWWLERKLQVGEDVKYRIFRLPLYVLVGMGVVGMLASVFHLGSPLNAPKAILNFGSSWLSREIVFAGLFLALLVVSGYLYIKKHAGYKPALLAAGIAGLVEIFAMAALYTNTIINAWNHIFTYISFYGTAFAAGAVLVLVLLYVSLKQAGLEEQMAVVYKTGFLSAVLAVAVQVAVVPVYMLFLYGAGQTAGMTAPAILDHFTSAMVIRWILALGGVGLTGYMALPGRKQKLAVMYAAFGFMLAAELVGRYIFYALAA